MCHESERLPPIGRSPPPMAVSSIWPISPGRLCSYSCGISTDSSEQNIWCSCISPMSSSDWLPTTRNFSSYLSPRSTASARGFRSCATRCSRRPIANVTFPCPKTPSRARASWRTRLASPMLRMVWDAIACYASMGRVSCSSIFCGEYGANLSGFETTRCNAAVTSSSGAMDGSSSHIRGEISLIGHRRAPYSPRSTTPRRRIEQGFSP
jgi:hypothetical protein